MLYALVYLNKNKMVDECNIGEYICKPEHSANSIDLMRDNISECICECNTKQILHVESSSIDLSTGNKYIIDTNDINANSANKKQKWSTSASVSDVVCLGATLVIVLIQLSVLIFYVFKDHESPEENYKNS